MNKQEVLALACLLLAGGCSAPRSFSVEDGVVREEKAGKSTPLVRTEVIGLLQVDAASVYRQMIEYFVPGVVLSDGLPKQTVQRETCRLEASLAFKPGSTELLPSYGGNRVELDRLRRELQGLAAKGEGLQHVRITGYAAPDGNTAKNEELALGRAVRFRRYLSQESGIPEQKIVVDQCSEDWDGLNRLAREAGKPYASQVASVLARTSDPDSRRKALKALGGGKVWKDMEKSLFAGLRRMQLTVEYDRAVLSSGTGVSASSTADVLSLVTAFNERPETLGCDELASLAEVYRPGTEQYREVYEVAAYRFPDCALAQLNAGAAAIENGDVEAARFFLDRVQDDSRSWINLGVLCLLEDNNEEAVNWFRKAMPVRPAKARKNMEWVKQLTN